MADRITIEKSPGSWVVRAGGAVLGESQNALVLREDGYPDVIYFPRDDIAMAFLERSEKTTDCPHKGTATYYSIVAEGATLTDAVWSYESPKQEVSQISGHLAFDGDDVTVEEV